MTEKELTDARARLINGISIDQLIVNLRGKQYRHLVQTHMRRFRTKLPAVIAASIELLTPEEKSVAEMVVDKFNLKGYDKAFWTSDAADILASVSCELDRAFFPARADPAGIFSVFQIVTGNFAWMSYQQKNLRKFMGIRLGWVS